MPLTKKQIGIGLILIVLFATAVSLGVSFGVGALSFPARQANDESVQKEEEIDYDAEQDDGMDLTLVTTNFWNQTKEIQPLADRNQNQQLEVEFPQSHDDPHRL